ncbi:DUF3127 domain-containing protein [Porphyromonas cangingivalis]|uniref:DUF3127 domain-containing protein n=1 Tax=Porphyromonas cangingivalis TaxID=36874 RepID=A0A1T4K125_PORCN|nr:DUF3127 domain-containing protein [Porphyromonas cangingivalis]SJZ36104.1 protein of unknown function [Porphyromonas cangingivalis]VEJ03334.1 Domain of uncharacterised function (DUF3127) [Porphyromonas cangingivalis]
MNTITGKIIAILPPATGESKKNPGSTWMRQEFVLETQEMYPRKVCFQIWGEDRIKGANIQMDDLVTVEYDIESREYQGRWYTTINGRTVTKGQPMAPNFGPAPTAPQMPGTENSFGSSTPSGADDLPF